MLTVRPIIRRLHPLAFLVAFACLLNGCSTEGTIDPDADPGADTGELQLTVSGPKGLADADPVVKGQVIVTGTIKAVGVKLTAGQTLSVKLQLPDGGVVNCPISGTTYTCDAIDTAKLDAAGKPVFKNNVGTGLTILGTAKGTDLTGSASVSIVVDNTLPVLTAESPVEGGAYIGHVLLKGSVSDKGADSVQIFLTPDGGEPVEIVPKDAKGAPKPLKSGAFELDLRPEVGPTRHFTLTIHAVDLAGNAADLSMGFTILKAPAFKGDNSVDGQEFTDRFDDVGRDVVTVDLDGDGVLDAIEVGKLGLAVRQGLHEVDAQKAPTAKGNGRFALPPLEDPGAKIDPDWRFKRIKGMDVRRVMVTDLDGDGDHDVIAVGMAQGNGAVLGPMAWALLNVSVPSDPALPAGNGIARLRKVDEIQLPDEPLSATLVNLNPDVSGQMDLVVGAMAPNKGLTTVLLSDALVCTCDKTAAECVAKNDCLMNSKGEATATVFPKNKQVSGHIVDKGVTGITAIAVGDFYKDAGSAVYQDLCVGEDSRPRVSCYRNLNHDGTLEQAQDSYILYDEGTSDSHFIMAVEWTSTDGKDGPDLLVSTRKGLLRWLRGNYNGGFKFEPKTDPQIIGPNVLDAVQANVGPGNSPYLFVTHGARDVLQIPLHMNTDFGLITNCFRSWVAADSVRKLVLGDYAGDSKLDLLSLDAVTGGLQVALGMENSDLSAPNVYHVCADTPGWGPRELAVAVAADFTKDGYPELLLVGKTTDSLQPGPSGSCSPTMAKPVWNFDLYMNQNKRFAVAPRVAEFAPYSYATAPGETAKQQAISGVTTDCMDAPLPIGDIVDWDVADMDGDGMNDLVSVRDGVYSSGLPPPATAGKCICPWKETNDTENLFGIHGPDENPGPGTCCRTYNVTKDKGKSNPLAGYGGGATMDRATLHVWLAKHPLKPFGLDQAAVLAKPPWVTPPIVVRPWFAQAGGANAVGVAVADFNKDKKMDIVTAMSSAGNRSDPEGMFLDARLRLFQGDGAGKVVVVPQTDVTVMLDSVSGLPYNVPVKYIHLDAQPVSVVAIPHCGIADLPTVFSLNSKEKTVSEVTNKGGMKLAPAEHTTVNESGVSAMALRNVDGKGCADLLIAASNSIGFLSGIALTPWFSSKTNLVESVDNDYVHVDLMDANGDTFVDLVLLDGPRASVDMYLGDGKGGFVPYLGHLLALDGAVRLQEVDVDKDGCLDFVVQSKFGATYLRNLACTP